MKKLRKCQIPNYLPDRKTPNCDYEKWCITYNRELVILYKILIINFCEKFDGILIQWDKNFDSFKRMIFRKSSKHLMRI